jgi:hypothetical protein
VDQRLVIFCWTAAGGIGLGGIGALFGGLAGYAARLHGRSPGGFVGWRVLRAIEQVSRRELSPRSAGIVIGAFDGATFLGTAGALLGFVASQTEWLSGSQLLAALYTFAVVATLAAVIGTAAYSFTRGGILVFGSACIGGLAGIYVGALLAETPGMMAGAWIGLLLGFLAGSIGRRARPRRKRWENSRIEFEEREP